METCKENNLPACASKTCQACLADYNAVRKTLSRLEKRKRQISADCEQYQTEHRWGNGMNHRLSMSELENVAVAEWKSSDEIGGASGRGRECQCVQIAAVAV